MAAVIDGAINARLLAPSRWLSFTELAQIWSRDVIEVTVSGLGAFSESPSLPNKIRGALGRTLLEGASSAVRARRPCDWRPPCAADVFFGEKPTIQIAEFSSQIPKPFVFAAVPKGQDLIVRMTVFGFATEWSRTVAEALASALRTRVRWTVLAQDRALFVPAPIEIRRLRISSKKGLAIPAVPNSVQVHFRTPLDAERGSLEDRPHLIFERLARRLTMLARWHDAALDLSWGDLEAAWTACDYDLLDDGLDAPNYKARKGGHRFRNAVTPAPVVSVSGDLAKVWPLLVIGESTHVGRGATLGLGRYCLVFSDD